FNNLMQIVGGYSEVLLGLLPDDHPGRGPVGEIKKAQERCAFLTRQLLAFGFEQPLSFSSLDPNAVLSRAESMLHRLLEPGVELAFALADDVGRVWADPMQLERVLLNVAANARDAMPSGGRFTLATALVEPDDDERRRRPGLRAGRYV